MKYTKENFDKLRAELTGLNEFLKTLTDIEDKGSCNLDNAIIDLTGWPTFKVKLIPYVSGKISSGMWKGYVFLRVPCNGVANNRSHRMELVKEYLQSKGIECSMYYQLD